MIMDLVVELCVALIKQMRNAGSDAQKQQDALMAAEERIAQLRAKAKFG